MNWLIYENCILFGIPIKYLQSFQISLHINGVEIISVEIRCML